jgi:hypothetical protein
MSQQLQYPQAQYGSNAPIERGLTGQGSNVGRSRQAPYAQQGQSGQQPSQFSQQGQSGQTPSQFGQQGTQLQSGRTFAESVPTEIVTAVQDLDRLETVAEWVHSRAMQKNVPQVAKLCDDLAMIAHFEKALIVRDSPLAGTIGQGTKESIQMALNQLQQFGGDPEIDEVITVAQRTVTTIDAALNRLGAMDPSSGGVGQQSGVGGTQGYSPNVGVGQGGSYGQMGP